MVTSQELAQARIQAERTRTQLAEQRRKTIESATSKKALLQQGGVAGRQSRATTIQRAGQISEQEKALSSYESQLKTAEQQLQQQQAQQSEYETAVKVYAGLIKRPSGFDENSQITKQAKEYVESKESKYGSSPLKNLKIYTSSTGEKYLSTPELEKVGAESFVPYQVSNTAQSKKYNLPIGAFYTPKTITDITPITNPISSLGDKSSISKSFETPEGTMYRRQVSTYKDKSTGNVIPVSRIYIIKNGKEQVASPKEAEFYKEQTNYLIVPDKQTGIEGVSESLLAERNRLATERLRENSINYKGDFSSYLVGVGASFVSTGLFFKDVAGTDPIKAIDYAINNPLKVINAIPSKVKSVLLTAEKSVLSLGNVGSVIKNEPFYALGYATGEIAQDYLMGKVVSRDFTLFSKKPTQVTATPEFEKEVQPFTRQRATLILKTEDGKYILGETKSGQIISIGGGVEAGQTTRQAILSELRQETGLTIDDIKNLKSKGKIVTAEETFKVYTATVPDEALKKIVASSDIKGINVLSYNQIGKVTGQTANYPITLPSGVRAYEGGIINWLETGKKPTLLKVKTKLGEYYLGTQSRYNVPYSSQRKYLATNEPLLLASGTTTPPVLNRFLTMKDEFEVLASKTKRGQAQGLYLQPPILAKIGSAGYVGLSYAGIGDDLTESLGFTFKKPKRVVYTLREEAVFPITITPKTLSGAESELIISPSTTLKTKGKSEAFGIGRKKVFFQPLGIVKDAETISEISRLQNIVNVGTSAEKLSALKKLSGLTGIDYTAGSLTYINLPAIATKTLTILKTGKEEIKQEPSTTVQLNKVYEVPTEKPKQSKEFNFIPNIKEEYKTLEKVKELSFIEPVGKIPYKKELVKKIFEVNKKTKKPYFLPKVSSYVSGQQKSSAKKTLKNIFDIFKKEKGVFKKVGEAETPYLAGRKLSTELFKDLSASGFVEKQGKKLKFEKLGMNPQFRMSKQKGKEFLAVQKQTGFWGGRLSTASERRQIQQSRKKKVNWFD